MKLSKAVCEKCKYSSEYHLIFKGLGFLFLSGVKCKNCGREYKIKGMLKGMSLQYVDVFGKLMFLANGLYFILLKYYVGTMLMFLMILLMNYILYPFFFRIKLLRIECESQ